MVVAVVKSAFEQAAIAQFVIAVTSVTQMHWKEAVGHDF
jgi:hypothetical protein